MRDPMSAFDKIITEAQQEGKFEELEGKGKPLQIDTSPDAVVKGILKEANVSITPEWITLAIEIDRLIEEDEQALTAFAARYEAGRSSLMDEPCPPSSPEPTPEPWWRRWWRALLRGWADDRPATSMPEAGAGMLQQQWDRELSLHAARLHRATRKIRRFNQIVPLANRQRPLLKVEERLRAFVEKFPRPERTAEGGWQFVRATISPALLTPPTEEQETEGRRRDVMHAAALARMRQGGRKLPPMS
jgi:hypothetical protein